VYKCGREVEIITFSEANYELKFSEAHFKGIVISLPGFAELP
jgi:hypothetical protein